jgi:hypothetical protein
MFSSGGLSRLIGENMSPKFSENSLCKTCDRAAVHQIGPSKHFWNAA